MKVWTALAYNTRLVAMELWVWNLNCPLEISFVFDEVAVELPRGDDELFVDAEDAFDGFDAGEEHPRCLFRQTCDVCLHNAVAAIAEPKRQIEFLRQIMNGDIHVA